MQELGGEGCVPGLGSTAVGAHVHALGGGIQAVASPISGTGSRRRDHGLGEGGGATGQCTMELEKETDRGVGGGR